MEPEAVLATITGRDRPGIVASLFAALAAHDVDVRDVEQLVIRDRLLLTVLLDARGEIGPLRDSVQRTAHALGMDAEVVRAGPGSAQQPLGASSICVTIMGRALRPGAIGAVASRITDLDANIQTITQLASEPTMGVELLVSAPDTGRLCRALLEACVDTGVEVAVQAAARRRLATRAVLLGIESIVVPDPQADELTGLAAIGRAWTEPAGPGGPARPNDPAATPDLADRVGRLAGVSAARLAAASERVRMHPDAPSVVAALRSSGHRVGLVSSGLSTVARPLAERLELDFVTVNRAEVDAGALTGRLAHPVRQPGAPVSALRRFASRTQVPLAQTVVVGTSSADLEMLEQAGIGVVVGSPQASGTNPPRLLGSLLFVLGITDLDRDADLVVPDLELDPAGCC
jgi:phosphoserine phosphatase